MKKILVFTAILLVHLTQAQLSPEQSNDENKKSHIQKGSWVISGLFSVNKINNENNSPEINAFTKENRLNYSISPQIGYTFSNNWIGGVNIEYSFNKNNSDRFESEGLNRKNRTKGNSYSISPFVTRFFNLSKNLFLNLKGSVQYTYFKSDNKYDSTTNETNYYTDEGESFFIGFTPGITYFLNNNLALESALGSFGYRKSETDYSDSERTQKTNSFNANIDLSSIYFGVSYYF